MKVCVCEIVQINALYHIKREMHERDLTERYMFVETLRSDCVTKLQPEMLKMLLD